jgi:DNA-binding MarR family transcriptional regulator
MGVTNMFLEITFEELQLMLRNIVSETVVSNHLERFIIYAAIIAKNENKTINVKYIQAESQQSFYHCNQAIKRLIKNEWISESINLQDKRNKNLLPTQKSLELVKAYEEIRANSLAKKGINKLPKPKNNITFNDMINANESQLNKIKDNLFKKR